MSKRKEQVRQRDRADGRVVEKEKRENRRERNEAQQGRTTAEWVVLAVSLALVLSVVGLLVYDIITTGDQPPVIEASLHFDELRQEEDGYYLPVSLVNQGGRTAEDVTVSYTLEPLVGEPESASVTIRFLAPNERDSGVLIFDNDPSQGTLVNTKSYVRP